MNKIPFLEKLQTGAVLVSDGATGTNHQHRGLGIGIPPDDLVFDNPEQVVGLHRDFIEAGSDIILTDTFGGTPIRMTDSRFDGRAAELNKRAAELARQAADPHGVYVAGSMGPTGSLFEPMGSLTHPEAVETYAVQAAALTEGGVDFLIIETMFSIEEARAAIEGAQKASDLPIICSFSFDMGVHTMMGTTPSQMVEVLKPLGLVGMGANCGKSLEFMEQVLEQLVESEPGVPLWIKPNAGLPIAGEWPPEYDVGPEKMGAYAGRFVQNGAQVVGGCCGSTPEHIRAVSAAVKAPAEED